MSVDRIEGKNTKSACVQASLALFLLPLLPSCLTAQTIPPAQIPHRGKTDSYVPATPKWIEDATVDFAFKDAGMATLLEKIHEETGITVLREGYPVLAAANLSFHGPLKSALNQIAETFDYTWAPSKKISHALVFNKRFRSPEEHPEWREKEMLHVAEQVCRALQIPSALSETYGNTRDLLPLLYHKLSPDQLQFLSQGGKLSLQDLNAGQTLLLNQEIYSAALGGVNRSWLHLQSRLAHLKDAKLVFRSVGIYKTLMLVFPSAVDGALDSVMVRIYTEADLAKGAAEASVAPINLERPLPLSVQAAAQESREEATLQKRVDVRMQGGRLADLMNAVSQRGRCKITVADYLQGQNLSLWTKSCSIQSLIVLLAEQNEWDWAYTTLTGITIARRDTTVPANLAAVSAVFQTAMPPGYRHFLGWDIDLNNWLKGDEDPETQFNRSRRGGNMMTIRKKANFKASTDGIDDPVMLRIWPTQPQKFPGHGELSFKDWTPQTKEAVLWSLFANAMRGFFEDRGFDVIAGRLTPYERNPELVKVHYIGLENGHYGFFGFSCTAFDPNYEMINTPGVVMKLKDVSAPLPPSLEEISKRY